jgi:serine/threonine protein kinase
MPPEYINDGVISNKFDVFSLGVIIIKMLAGNTGYDRRHEMPPERFMEFVRKIAIVCSI